MNLIWKGNWRDDPRDFMNWIFFHGIPIDFNALFLSTELSVYISPLPEFKEAPTITRMRAYGESMFYYGDFMGISVWRDMDADKNWGEIVDNNFGRTIEFKAIMGR